jgi:putative ABC transport system ATP-binding protein
MLQLHSLSHRPGGAQGPHLRFPDVQLPAGRHLLILGPSGSGKSTLLALIAGLLTPHSGTVRVGEVVVSQLPARARDAWRGATLGFVPQRLHLSASLSVRDNLHLPFVCTGEAVDTARVAAVMQRLGLAELAARKPHQLSVGQAQRVALARALLRSPQLIVADEPTASLDDAHASAVMTLLHQAATDTGATLVVATHDHRVAHRMAQAEVLSLSVPHEVAA